MPTVSWQEADNRRIILPMPGNDHFLKKGTLFSGEADASPE
ncbi:hypothetical protein FAEPRAM212_00793 [Faecalibacterium prausnitzii M21/2]|uniref:Uncharacterized protein n=1 Tax=Faecalibacterium prausnitzii M21/2 TaxID=411485 RepID=A8S8K4_9FIRM|nr:hypothetical protein FAEPRAM212_00793 [Faecalibacterium prausnitzii M21/2]